MKKLNNKGYMIIEIVLASAIAMGVGLFITQLTLNLKNKNDDMVVRTLVVTDQAIMTNTIMKHVYYGDFDCGKLVVDTVNKKFAYDGFEDYITEYATVKFNKCNVTSGKATVNIELRVPQLPDEKFDINIVDGAVL